MPQRRIYVVDNEDAVRTTTAALFQDQGWLVQGFSGGKSFIDAARNLQPGCMLLDIYMPEPDGLFVLKWLRQNYPQWPVIVMTGYGNVSLAVQAMKLGASDFAEKPLDPAAIVHMAEVALQHSPVVLPSALVSDLVARHAALSPREREVMEHMTTGSTTKEIAHALEISLRTVDVYRGAVLSKMGAKNTTTLARLAIHAGLVSYRGARS